MKLFWLSAIALLLLASGVYSVTPIISSFQLENGAQFTKNKTWAVSLSAIDAAKMQFSCDGNHYSALQSYASQTTFLSSSALGCSSSDGTVIVTAKLVSSDGNASITQDSIGLDFTPPNIPVGLQVGFLPKSKQAIASWNPSTDDASGISSYVLYESDSKNSIETQSQYTVFNPSFAIFSGNVSGTKYYAVRSYDGVGNASALSGIVSVNIDFNAPEETIEIYPAEEWNGQVWVKSGTIELHIQSSERLKQKPTVTAIIRGKENSLEVIEKSSGTEFDANWIVFPETQGRIDLNITLEDLAGNVTHSIEPFFADSIAPTIEFNEPNRAGIETAWFNAKFSPDVQKIVFDYRDSTVPGSDFQAIETVKTAIDSNALEWQWNFADVTALEAELRATAFDRAGNAASDSIVFALQPKKLSALKSMQRSRKFEQQTNTQLIELNEYYSVTVSPKLLEQKKRAENWLAESDSLFEAEDFDAAKERSERAYNNLLWFESLSPKARNVSGKRTDYFIASAESILKDFNYLILDQNAAFEAAQNLQSFNVQRELAVVQVKDGSKTDYQIVARIQFSGTNSAKKIQLIEPIPKSLAKHLNQLRFSEDVNVIESDPVVYAKLSIPAGGKKTFSYALSERMDFRDANAVMEDSFQRYYPPILLNEDRFYSNRLVRLPALNPKPIDLGYWPLTASMIVILISFAKLRPENFTEEEIEKTWESIADAVKKD